MKYTSNLSPSSKHTKLLETYLILLYFPIRNYALECKSYSSNAQLLISNSTFDTHAQNQKPFILQLKYFVLHLIIGTSIV